MILNLSGCVSDIIHSSLSTHFDGSFTPVRSSLVQSEPVVKVSCITGWWCRTGSQVCSCQYRHIDVNHEGTQSLNLTNKQIYCRPDVSLIIYCVWWNRTRTFHHAWRRHSGWTLTCWTPSVSSGAASALTWSHTTWNCSQRRNKKTEEEKQSKNKEVDRAREETRINIRASCQRWRSCGSVRTFLLDR